MRPPNYESGLKSLRENLSLLANPSGSVAPENRVLWNLSQGLLEALNALQGIEERVQIIERMLAR